MSYPHTRHQIHERVQAPNVMFENSRLKVAMFGEHSGRYDVSVGSLDSKDRAGYITPDCIMPVTP